MIVTGKQIASTLDQAKPWSEPEHNFLVRPSFTETMSTLQMLYNRCEGEENFHIAVDLETRHRQIACVGLAWSNVDAICIPLMCVENPKGYWSYEEEVSITLLLRKILTHKNAYIIGQNYAYDRQYIARQWGIMSTLSFDTMVAQHVLWPGAPKGLDFLSSLYSRHHVYWKDESKEWGKEDEDTLWVYNCKDCVATFEVAQELQKALQNDRDWETS